MGVLQSFERRLQGAVAATFARLFGGSVHPTEVADALQTEASSHLQHQAGRTIAPNRYTVRLGPTDSDGVGQDEERVASVLSAMIREYLDEQGWQTFGDVAVTLEESDALHTGQFRISSLVDPDVDRRSAHRSAGVPRMTQQPEDGAQQSRAKPPGGSSPAGSAGPPGESPADGPPRGPSGYGPSDPGPQAGAQLNYPPSYEPQSSGPQGHGPQGYGPPENGPQGYGPQGYGPQGYGPPEYGPPSDDPQHYDPRYPGRQPYDDQRYAQPSYDQPPYGQPSYEQQSYEQQYPPVGPPGHDPGQAPPRGQQLPGYPPPAPYGGPASDPYGQGARPSGYTPGYTPGYEPPAHPPAPDHYPGQGAYYPGQGPADQRELAEQPRQYGRSDYGPGYVPSYQQEPADLQAVLSVDDGSHRTYQLQRGSNVVGRGQDASFRLPDTSVSRRHLDIYFDGQVAVMHDLGSTNGTSVNGSNVQTWQLADGDVVRVGHSTVVFNLHR